jgi:hypothetical protein
MERMLAVLILLNLTVIRLREVKETRGLHLKICCSKYSKYRIFKQFCRSNARKFRSNARKIRSNTRKIRSNGRKIRSNARKIRRNARKTRSQGRKKRHWLKIFDVPMHVAASESPES